MIHFLYCTVNLVNGMLYVGKHSTENINDGYLGSGKRLRQAIKKYGNGSFERHILSFYNSSHEALAVEAKIVDADFLQDENTYNLTLGGGLLDREASLRGVYASHKTNWGNPEFRERARKRFSDLGKKTGAANLQRLRDNGMKPPSFKGKKHREESKRAIGTANALKQTGEKNSQFGTVWIYSLEQQSSKKVSALELSSWLEQGWLKGRKIKW